MRVRGQGSLVALAEALGTGHRVDRGCRFEGCEREPRALGLCKSHYSQQRRGRPLSPLGPTRKLLTDDERQEIARRYVEGETTYALAEVFGVSDGTIGNALKRLGIKRRSSGDYTRGVSILPEVRARIGASLRGHPVTPQTRDKIRAGLWRGDDVGYGQVHKRVKDKLPQACALADATCKGPLQSSFRHSATPIEFVRETPSGVRPHGPYSTRPEDYWRLCRSHHARYDHPANSSRSDR